MDTSISASCNSPKLFLSSITTIEEGIDIIETLLGQEILCSHDVIKLNHAYKLVNYLEQQTASITQEKSHSIANQIAEKIQAIHHSLLTPVLD
ncbi:MAG: hypothetical protein QRY72_05395 [Candidatus Rhabdochlamydia sp.]